MRERLKDILLKLIDIRGSLRTPNAALDEAIHLLAVLIGEWKE